MWNLSSVDNFLAWNQISFFLQTPSEQPPISASTPSPCLQNINAYFLHSPASQPWNNITHKISLLCNEIAIHFKVNCTNLRTKPVLNLSRFEIEIKPQNNYFANLKSNSFVFVLYFIYLTWQFHFLPWQVNRRNWLTLSDRYLEEKILPLSRNKSNFNPEGNNVVAASHALPWCLCACICLPSPISAGETP